MKVTTKNYGEKNILLKEPIEGLENLYKAEIHVPSYGRENGIINFENKEVFPFGDYHISNLRVIDGKYLLIDAVLIYGIFGNSDVDLVGTFLYLVEGNDLKPLCTSEAEVMKQSGDHLFGRHANLQNSDDAYIDYQNNFMYDLKRNQEISSSNVFDVKIKQMLNNGNTIIAEFHPDGKYEYILNLNDLSQPMKKFQSIRLEEYDSKKHIVGYLSEITSKCGEKYRLYCFLNENGEIISDIYNTYDKGKVCEKDCDFDQIISEFIGDIKNGEKEFVKRIKKYNEN